MADRLKTYRQKRDFARTPEPRGATAPPAAGEGNRFVVHKHWATADHYDLRLEHDGVLKSWAVPKGPSLDPDDKRFAAETEDHPLDYFDFEGVIPQGEYGGGPMIVWDWGTWAPMEDTDTALRKGAFKFRLAGEKLKGGWMLARLKQKPGEKTTGWLLFKEHDLYAYPGTDILVARPESVKTGRRIEELLAPLPAPPRPAKAAKVRPSALPGAVKAPMPQAMKPELATPAGKPPEGADWLHEIKFDGYRTIVHVAGGEARLITRAGLDWSGRYRALAEALAALPVREAIIDGEVVVVDERGVTRFQALQQALSAGESHRLTYYAFDLMYLDGYDLAKVPLLRRKQTLQALLAPVVSPRSPIQYSDHVLGDGGALYAQAAEHGLEGIVSKRADSPYVQMRSATWLKTKALKAADLMIVGFTTSEAAGGLAALALGQFEDGELHYRGKVGSGFDAETLRNLSARLASLVAPELTLPRAPRDVIPVRPVLAAHIHFAGYTRDGSVRHAVFKGLREPGIGAGSAPAAAPARKRLISDADLAGITITNPTRRLFGSSGPTKLDVAVYYAAVGDFMLPHIFRRPVSLVRSPSGKMTDLFFQRHPFGGMPPTIASFEVRKAGGEDRRYIAVEDAKGYLALAQFGVIEFHTWGCHREDIEHADRVVFDLDPGEGVSWRDTVKGAHAVRAHLEALGLVPFLKTSGGKGLHVVVPLKPVATWDRVHAATGEIAARIAAAHEDTFVVNMAREKRRRRIFIDFHRNARTATAVAPYSLRARTNLPASIPLRWQDVDSIDAPEDLNYSSVPGFLSNSGDPWADMDDFARELPAASGPRKK